MSEDELEYYRSKLDTLTGDLLHKEYQFATLNNELIQLNNGFRLLISIASGIYKLSDIHSLIALCNENILQLLHMDISIVFERFNSQQFKIASILGDNSYNIKNNQIIEYEVISNWFDESNSIFSNSQTPKSKIQEEIQAYTGLPFYVGAIAMLDSKPEYIFIAGRFNERKPLRHSPLSKTDKYIFESIATLFAGIASKLQFDEKMEAERNRIARDMHDNLGAEITGISLLTNQLFIEPSISESAKHKLSNIKKSSDEIVEHLGNTIWMLNSGNNKLEDMVAYMRSYLGKIGEELNIKINLTDTGIGPDLLISQEKRHHIFMVFKEAINNINKYADATSIIIKIQLDEEYLHIEITDNGVGFETERQFGNGLKNMRKRMHECNGKIAIQSAAGRGTSITIALPSKEISH